VARIIKDKFEQVIKPLIRNKNILDFGNSGQLLNKIPTKNKIHLYSEMKKVARFIVGVDLRRPNLNKKIENEFVYGNAETINLRKKFDVVVCCDLIEHIMNQGLLLQNCKRHLKNNGFLIISTPNAKSWRILFKPFKAHVLWHDKYTLIYLLEKNGFKLERFYYYYGNKIYPNYLNLIFRLFGKFNQGLLIVAKLKMSD
jgi:2-polyprenyl-3-methyl-5-hydroxy-6-metoxy-1,4-benzoquinol methylase